jgi:uncharacterized protein (TIGR02246 family)
VSTEEEIASLIDAWVAAIRAKDLDGSLSYYAPDVIGFDLVEPLRYVGADALRKRLEDWFASFDGTIDFENHELEIIGGDGVAFAHSLNHVTGTLTDGKSLDMYWRATLCLRKVDGEWLVVHTHTSVPFNMQTGEAQIDLKP